MGFKNCGSSNFISKENILCKNIFIKVVINSSDSIMYRCLWLLKCCKSNKFVFNERYFYYITVLLQCEITVAFCNKTVELFNKKFGTFCNKPQPHFVIK